MVEYISLRENSTSILERETDRQTERETERQRETERDRESPKEFMEI